MVGYVWKSELKKLVFNDLLLTHKIGPALQSSFQFHLWILVCLQHTVTKNLKICSGADLAMLVIILVSELKKQLGFINLIYFLHQALILSLLLSVNLQRGSSPRIASPAVLPSRGPGCGVVEALRARQRAGCPGLSCPIGNWYLLGWLFDSPARPPDCRW